MSLPKTTETTSVCIPSWLLELVDEYCARNDMSRSAFIVRCIRKYAVLKFETPELWEHIYKKRLDSSCEDL
jgi:hypothetical protein